MPKFNPMFNPTDEFSDNILILEKALGHSIKDTRYKLVKLVKPDGSSVTLSAVEGEFAYCAFLQYLGQCCVFHSSSYLIGNIAHQQVCSFFGPLWNIPGHPTIDFLRDPGLKVEPLIFGNDQLITSDTDLPAHREVP